jgi:hypothetical protein
MLTYAQSGMSTSSSPPISQISLQGAPRAIATARRLLALPDEPEFKDFRFSAFPYSGAAAAQ